jgi:hypothetical protein
MMPRNNPLADEKGAHDVNEPSLNPPLFLQLRLLLPQRQMKKGLVHAATEFQIGGGVDVTHPP